MIKKWTTLGLGLIIGGIAGYLYWYFVGCTSGSCPITSSPVNSTLYGGLVGGLLGNPFGPASGKKDNAPH